MGSTRVDPTAEEERRGIGAAEVLAARLDRPMGALGILFLFVVLGQNVAHPPLSDLLSALGWVLWAVFVLEFALRAYVAKEQKKFWRRNWWQVLFLAVPFLRFFRALSFLRFARVGRTARIGGVLSSAIRGSRSAGRLLTGRIAWVAVLTAVIILASSQVLLLIEVFDGYADALHAAALATMTGEPFGADSNGARILETFLAGYSVVVFATLAGALGAYFLQRPQERDEVPPAARE